MLSSCNIQEAQQTSYVHVCNSRILFLLFFLNKFHWPPIFVDIVALSIHKWNVHERNLTKYSIRRAIFHKTNMTFYMCMKNNVHKCSWNQDISNLYKTFIWIHDIKEQHTDLSLVLEEIRKSIVTIGSPY